MTWLICDVQGTHLVLRVVLFSIVVWLYENNAIKCYDCQAYGKSNISAVLQNYSFHMMVFCCLDFKNVLDIKNKNVNLAYL